MERHPVLVLPPISPVGDRPHYFWVLQKWLHVFRKQKTTVVIPVCYISAFGDMTRWEYNTWSTEFHGYEPIINFKEHPASICFYPCRMDEGTDNKELPPLAPAARFTESVYHEDEVLVAFYTDILKDVQLKQQGKKPLVIAWVNNASLRRAVVQESAELVFNEIGPLRRPFYRQTAYWDRNGVNGNTSVESLWIKERSAFETWLSTRPSLRTADGVCRIFTEWFPSLDKKIEAEVGLAMQIESDSNALLFNRGWTNLSLVEYLRETHVSGNYLIRYHPNGKAVYEGMADHFMSPLVFLFRVGEVWTINSSLGMEAFLWERPVRFFGSNPVSFATVMKEGEQRLFRAWFFLRYLIPWQCLFSIDYYIWRIREPSCNEIAERHLALYADEALATPSLEVKEPSALEAIMVGDPKKVLGNLVENRMMSAVIETQYQQIEDRDCWVKERDETISLMSKQIEDRDCWVKERDETISLMSKQIEDRDCWVKERDETISLMSKQIEDRDCWVKERDETISLMSKQIEDRDCWVKERDETISLMSKQIEDRDCWVKERDETISLMSKQIEDRDCWVKERDETISLMSKQIEDRDCWVKERDETISLMSKQIEDRDCWVKERDETISLMSKQIEDRNKT